MRISQTARILTAIVLAALVLDGCTIKKMGDKRIIIPTVLDSEEPLPPAIRQPVLPEMLVPCRGHVLVPALGMIFVSRGAKPPESGQFLREERLSAPYRIVPTGASVSRESNPARLNVEIDKYRRIIGFYCG
jgi:hypothetical protein